MNPSKKQLTLWEKQQRIMTHKINIIEELRNFKPKTRVQILQELIDMYQSELEVFGEIK